MSGVEIETLLVIGERSFLELWTGAQIHTDENVTGTISEEVEEPAAARRKGFVDKENHYCAPRAVQTFISA